MKTPLPPVRPTPLAAAIMAARIVLCALAGLALVTAAAVLHYATH